MSETYIKTQKHLLVCLSFSQRRNNRPADYIWHRKVFAAEKDACFFLINSLIKRNRSKRKTNQRQRLVINKLETN